MADALGYAHANGVFHRDVKPENILVLPEASAKLVDFGIAGLAALSNSLVLGYGTLPYMSPEQLSKQDLDGRSDIWSLGVTMFEFLTGALPFRTPQELAAARTPELPRGFTHFADLNCIFARALARDRRQRYPRAEDLAADLRTIRLELQRTDQSTGTASVQLDWRVLSGSQATTVSMAPPGFSLPINALPAEEARTGATLPSLNFNHPVTGTLEVASRRSEGYKRQTKVREAQGRVVDGFLRSAPQLLIVIVLSLTLGHAPRLGLTLAFMCGALFFNGKLAAAIRIPERLPQCRACGQWMRATAEWTRYCKTVEDVVFAYRDCLAAMAYGRWEGAAKLMSIYGAERLSEYGNRFITAAKYNLAFFECATCGHHAARITSGELIGDRWEEVQRYHEAYWGTEPTARGSNTIQLAKLRVASGLALGFVREYRAVVLVWALVAGMALAVWRVW